MVFWLSLSTAGVCPLSHLDSALTLARKGTAVFPVNPDKSPRTPRGFHDATTDETAIRAWDWNSGGMLAACIPEGVIVVDVDPRHGGDATLAALLEAYEDLPATRTVQTGGGGHHYYFSVPEHLTLRSTLGPGIDIKRSGKGYVVVPPSEGYSYERGGQVAPAPYWMMAELVVENRPTGGGEAVEGSKFFPQLEDGTTYGIAGMERELGRLAQQTEGGRNNALNRAAFALAQLSAGGELSEEVALRSLEHVASQIGLSDTEARATIASAWKSGTEAPRQAPEREVTGTTSDVRAEPLEAEKEGRFWSDWEVDEPAPPFYLHPLVPKNAYVLVYGPTEASKSMVWTGLLAQASNRGLKCSVYSLENPPSTDRDRLRRLHPTKANFRLTNQPLDLNSSDQLDRLVEREREWDTDLLLIDTYSHAFNSRSDDGNAKAIDFARRVRWIMHNVGCTVIVVDHTGYAQSDEPRDASAKRQAVDCAYLMEKRGEWRPGQPSAWAITNKKAARFANPCYYTGEIRDTSDNGLEIAFIGGGPKWRV